MALGIVIWAVAAVLGRQMRAQFIEILDDLADQHEKRVAASPLTRSTTSGREMTRATRIAVNWLRRIVDELRAADG